MFIIINIGIMFVIPHRKKSNFQKNLTWEIWIFGFFNMGVYEGFRLCGGTKLMVGHTLHTYKPFQKQTCQD